MYIGRTFFINCNLEQYIFYFTKLVMSFKYIRLINISFFTHPL
jgi:hypothetical protein